MARKLSDKQIAIFGTKAQKAALKRRRRSAGRKSAPSRSRARRSPRRARSTGAHMARKKTSHRKQKKAWLDLAADTNTAIQLAEPFIAPAMQAAAGDVPGAIQAARPALAEAASMKNIGQVATGYAVRGVARKGLRALGVRSPKLFGRRLW